MRDGGREKGRGGERGGVWEERKEEEALDGYIYNVSMRVKREGEGRGEAWMRGGREEEGGKGGGGGGTGLFYDVSIQVKVN